MSISYANINFAVIIPMANEAHDFAPFVAALKKELDELGSGTVYFVVDNASKDNTLELCSALSQQDRRFITVYAPENKHVVHAYLRGFQEAYRHHHDIIIEMDAGLSHDPVTLRFFIQALHQGYACAFGSRNIAGGSNTHSPFFRRALSKVGTMLSNMLLGTRLSDMTSGYQGFRREVVEKLIHYPLLSVAHFYQTEVRYLLRHYKSVEIPIHYQSPSPRVRWKSIQNSLAVLWYYTKKRFMFRGITL